MSASPVDRSLNARAAARISWGKTRDRTARTAAARAAAEERFARLADPDGVLAPAERARAAEQYRRAHMLQLARKSVASRRRGRAARREVT